MEFDGKENTTAAIKFLGFFDPGPSSEFAKSSLIEMFPPATGSGEPGADCSRARLLIVTSLAAGGLM